jgi:hypothetical protein
VTERDQDRGDGRDPIDEDAAWAEIVAGYGAEPADPPGVWPSADQLDLTDTIDRVNRDDESDLDDLGAPPPAHEVRPEGPRDWEPAEDEEEDHFVPPEPPPLPKADLATRLAWLAALGGPLLLVAAVILQWPMSWWIVTLGVGGFLGGFAALVTRLRDGDDDDPAPGNGAVV